MAKSKLHTVPHKRKGQGKTDYKARLNLLKSGKKRLIIRKTLKNMICQIVDYSPKGDKVIVTVHSKQLKKMGWKHANNNSPGSYLTGYLLGKKAAEKGVTEAVLDIGLQTSSKGSRIYAALKGVLDAGINVPHSDDVLPDDERIKGKHIAEYAKSLDAGKKQFSTDVTNIDKDFEEVKGRIDGQK